MDLHERRLRAAAIERGPRRRRRTTSGSSRARTPVVQSWKVGRSRGNDGGGSELGSMCLGMYLAGQGLYLAGQRTAPHDGRPRSISVKMMRSLLLQNGAVLSINVRCA